MRVLICFFLLLTGFFAQQMSGAKNAEVVSETPITYPRTVVYEEGTGTWCGFCPAGIVLMEKLKKAHPDNFICIAVHRGDRMEISGYRSLAFSGLPRYWVNRIETRGILFDDAEEQFLVDATPSEGKVEASLTELSDRHLKLSVKTTLGFTTTEANYRLAYVVTEDSVGPYSQKNYFPNDGLYGEIMAEWRDLSTNVPWKFCDVAREIYPTFSGQKYSVPSSMEQGVPSSYDFDVWLPSNLRDRNNAHIVVLLIDGATGRIVNATQLSLAVPTKIPSVRAYDKAPHIYDLAGRRHSDLQRGLNIVNGRKVIRENR